MLKDLISHITNHPEYNFLAKVFTPWHMIGVKATLEKLKKEGIIMKGVGIVSPHPLTGYAIHENEFPNECVYTCSCDTTAVIENVLADKYHFYKYLFADIKKSSRKKDFYIIVPVIDTILASQIYRVLPDRHIKFILFDEGVATYINTLWPRPNPFCGWSNFMQFLRYLHCHIMGQVFVEHTREVLHNQLFTYSSLGQLVQNKYIYPYYIKVLSQKAETTSIEGCFASIKDSVVICTTAWDRSKIIGDEDFIVLKKVCEYLHSKGLRLFLKPHPRDMFFTSKADLLYTQVIDSSLPMESICINYPPRCIISFSSTILVTAKVFWNIPVYCLSDMLDRSCIGEFYLKEIDGFRQVFKDMVLFPKECNQLLE